MLLTAEEMATACRGLWLHGQPQVLGGIGTDSRDFGEGDAFLALRGTTFDGHQHAAQVASKASALIGDVQGVQQWQSLTAIPQLQVDNTLQALGDVAACYRQKLQQTCVIAITGSYGKTTVRSMLTHVLRVFGLKVSATQENFNNLIGVPKTLMAVPEDADVALIECGISELGEMQRLSEIVQPDIAVITGVSVAHGEGLGGVQGVAKEKAKLMNHLAHHGWCALGHGVGTQLQQTKCHVSQDILDMDTTDAVQWELQDVQLTLTQQTQKTELTLQLPAKHWAEDMALVASIALRLANDLQHTWSLQDVTQALQSWSPVGGRMNIVEVNDNFRLIDDAYNANPASTQAALDTLADLKGHRVAMLGDMLELGVDAHRLHQQLDLHDIDEVLTVGNLMGSLQAANPHIHIRVFKDIEGLEAWLASKDFPPKGSTVLVKGSHGTGLYKLVDKLMKRGQHVI